MIIDNAGTYTLRYTATDDCGKTTTVDRELVVKSMVYGVEWDGSDATTWTRTDTSADFANPSPAVSNDEGSSPFDDIYPWSGMKIVEDAEAGTLVSIPKFYYKWTRNGDSMKLQISPNPQNGFFTSPAHADRGDGVGERDMVYVGRYHCCNTNYKSVTGDVPKTNITRNTSRQSIHALGSDVWQYDFSMYWTIAMLYLVEFADWNSQATIGYGCGGGSSVRQSGETDIMTYHTGTNAAHKTDYEQVQYRHIEGLWSNVRDWCDGIYLNGTNVYGINKPLDFSDTSNGTLIGTRPTSHGVPKTFNEPTAQGFEYALFPLTVSGSDYTVRTCDQNFNSSSGVAIYVGGGFAPNQSNGLFGLFSSSASFYDNSTGCRLMKLPNA